jgi:ORF6N domain
LFLFATLQFKKFKENSFEVIFFLLLCIIAKVLQITDELLMSRIIEVRGIKVMIDRDIAELYDVSTKRLNEQVKRNARRFPIELMFQLSKEEKDEVVAKCDHLKTIKYSSSLPYVFTEHGAIMMAGVLNSDRAVEVN